ncbi:GntR family transcriptional regulator [Streptomyces sp. NPDC056568]|uniref:GntR family transcriptional regulator n=1 Tax=Streptomyces sp. NPDC056568 TaxID=3345866 RepID=UPI00368D5265
MATLRGALQPITSRSVVEQATEELRRAILTGDLAPGAEYSLRELAGMLDISFIPIREALRSLESEGLVIMRPGRSAVIAPLDLDDLHGIYRLRRALEPEIARRACALLTDEELDRLESLASEFGAREHGMADIYDDHHAFHLALLAPAATAWDIRVLTTLWRAGERYIRIGFGRLDPDPTEHERRGKAHGDLLAAFRTRDPATVAAAVEQHLARNEKIAFSALS